MQCFAPRFCATTPLPRQQQKEAAPVRFSDFPIGTRIFAAFGLVAALGTIGVCFVYWEVTSVAGELDRVLTAAMHAPRRRVRISRRFCRRQAGSCCFSPRRESCLASRPPRG